MWGKVYSVDGYTGGPLDNADLEVWQDGANYRLDIDNDLNGNDGNYYKVATLNSGGDPFELIQFTIDDCHFYYKPGQERGIIYVTPEGVAIVTE